MRIAVPDADSQLKMNTAASGVGLATTGGMRSTILSRPAIGMFGAEMWLRNVFTCGVPHAKTITVRITHGISATRSGAASPARNGDGRRRAAPPMPKKERQTKHRAAGGEDVDQPRPVIVRHEELRNGERHAGDEQRRPHLEHSAKS